MTGRVVWSRSVWAKLPLPAPSRVGLLLCERDKRDVENKKRFFCLSCDAAFAGVGATHFRADKCPRCGSATWGVRVDHPLAVMATKNKNENKVSR